jgi:hypothetical protein
MSIDVIVGKLNQDALGAAVTKSEGMASEATKGPSFKEVMTQMDTGADFAETLGVGSGGQDINPTSLMQSIDGETVSFTPADEVTAVGKPEVSERVVDMLGEVNKGHMQMDSLVNHILYSGKRFSNQELLVIQAHVFHFAQMTELTVKVAEQSVSSVKTVLNTQVQ